jgi:hypothetical protein
LRIPHRIRLTAASLTLAGACLATAATPALAKNPSARPSSGGAGIAGVPFMSTKAHPMVRGKKAKIIHGVAYAPSLAPMQVKRAIWGGNMIRTKPYIAVHYSSMSWLWPGYDCSGTVSFVLYKAGLLSNSPDVSGDFESYGRPGRGKWISVWGASGHTFIEVAGIVMDTAQYAPVTPGGSGPRWQPASIIPAQLSDGEGYIERHPTGF